MTTSRERILELVAAGKLSAADAEKMLSAKGGRPSIGQWLANPLAQMSTSTGLVVSALFAAAALGLSRLGVRFSGPLSVQASSSEHVPWAQALLDVASSWLLPALLFWAAAYVFSRRVRWLDFLVMVGVARAPALVAAAAAAQLSRPDSANPEAVAALVRDPSFLISLPLLLLCLSWQVTMLVLGFRTASGLRGARWVVAFVATLALGEILGVALRGLW